MKGKYYILILLVPIFLCSSFVFSHNTQQSSFKLFLSDSNDNFIEIILSQYGVEQALINKYPDLNLQSITPKDFKELLVQHLKQNISMSVDGNPLNIGGGLIKLGSHQTNVRFKVNNFKGNPKYLDVNASCFRENEKQNNIFTVTYNGLTARANLSAENMFQSRYVFDKSNIEIMNFQAVN